MANASAPISTCLGGSVTHSDDVPITVKVYSDSDQPPTAEVFTNTGQSWTVPITYDSSGVGTGSVMWPGVADEIDYGAQTPYYAISAECEGFKTRTRTGICPSSVPDGGEELDLVPLRKISPPTAAAYELSPCGGGDTPASTEVTTYVVDADHNPIAGRTVEFWTDNATFASDGSARSTTTALTDSNGMAQVNVYATYTPNGANAAVMATCVLNAPLPRGIAYDAAAEACDWAPLQQNQMDSYIIIDSYQPGITLTPTNTTMTQCQILPITATLTDGGGGIANVPITFRRPHASLHDYR